MRIHARIAAVLVLGTATGACSDFLTGPGLTENPNNPTAVAYEQLFIAMQASQFVLAESQLARQAAMYTQQLAGTNNQQLNWGSQYLISEADLNNQFNAIYVGGGLLDMRRIRADATAAGDARTAAIAKIWEAYNMGMAASIWGDLPYREALSGERQRTTLDPQQQIYADVQTLLDQAIAEIGGTMVLPGNRDLVYGGNAERWRRLAYTLKARFHLHTAERLGASAYTAARTAAQQGINEAPTTAAQAMHGQAAGDMRALHGSTVSDGNLWAQFLQARQDMVAGGRLVDLLAARNDPRMAAYFEIAPAVAATATCAGYAAGYRGNSQFGGGRPQACASGSVVDTETRRLLNFRQPIVTWAENQMILAEAEYMLGNAPQARTHVNNVRTAVGMAALDDTATLNVARIMEEKYIVQFQNIDVWNDYKRTGCPQLSPGGSPVASEVPRRLPYGSNERLNNPAIPLPTEAPTFNWNDPNSNNTCSAA